MSYELLHFRDAEKALELKEMKSDIIHTLDYLDQSLTGSLYWGELLRAALSDMGWRENGCLKFIEGRRYQYKGFKRDVAIEGNLSVYEFILEGLCRLQIGYDKGLVETGVLLLTSKRSENTPYGSTSRMVRKEIETLYPTISLPVSVALFNLGDPELPE